MSDYKSKIRNNLIALIKQVNGAASIFSAEVTAVDIDTRTCTVVGISDETGTEYPNVWLMPEINDGLLYVPKIGSTVIVELGDNLQYFVCMWSAIDQVFYVVNNTTLSMTDGLTQFNKGEFGGIPKVVPSVKAWNDTQQKINDLITVFNSWTPASGDGGAALKTALTSWVAQNLAITAKSDIEDTAVTH